MPEKAAKHARVLVVDSLGSMIGLRDFGLSKISTEVVLGLGGTEESTVKESLNMIFSDITQKFTEGGDFEPKLKKKRYLGCQCLDEDRVELDVESRGELNVWSTNTVFAYQVEPLPKIWKDTKFVCIE